MTETTAALVCVNRFANQVVLVTAAASGIGRATAVRLAAEGATVVAIDIDGDGLAKLRRKIDATQGVVHTYQVDGLAPGLVEEAVRDAHARLGGVHALVNAVGGSTVRGRLPAQTEDVAFEDWKALMAFNLDSMFLFSSAVIPYMKAQGRGAIVNLSSIAARGLTVNSSAVYATAKGGVIAFTRKLAHELGPHGINVNAVAPGLTLTERMRPTWDGKTSEERRALLAQIPLRRLGTVEEHAAVVCFLASRDAAFITGACIDSTGGQ